MCGRSTLGQQYGCHPGGIEPGRSRRSEILGNENAAGLAGVGLADERAQHLVTDRAHIDGPGLEVRVGKGHQPGNHVIDGFGPRRCCAGVALDGGTHRAEQVRVVEQQQVGVEDGGVGLADLSCDFGAVALHVSTDLRDRLAQAPPLDGGISVRCVGRGRIDRYRGRKPRRRDTDAGGCGDRSATRGRATGSRARGHLVEVAGRECEHAVERFASLTSAGPHVDAVILQGTERRHSRQAVCGHPGRVGHGVAQFDLGIQGPDFLDHAGGWPGMQPVGERDNEVAPQRWNRAIRRRSWCLIRHVNTEVRLLPGECSGRFGDDLISGCPARGSDGCDDQPLDERRRTQCHASSGVIVEEVEGEFGREHRATQVHEDDDTLAVVGPGDRVDDLPRVGSEGPVVETCGDDDGDSPPVQHLLRQSNSGPSQGAAMGDDHQADHGRVSSRRRRLLQPRRTRRRT